MNDIYRLSRVKNIFAVKITAGQRIAFMIIALFNIIFPGAVFAQTLSLSYSTPQTYTTGTAITPLTPAGTGVVSTLGYSAPSTYLTGPDYGDNVGQAFDAAGNLYTATSNTVYKNNVQIAAGFKDITGIALDAAGNIFLSDDEANQILKIPAGGGATSVLLDGFMSPDAIAVDKKGNIYFTSGTDIDAGLFELPAGGGGLINFYPGINAGESVYEYGVATDAAGDVFYASRELSGRGAIYKIPAGGGAAELLINSNSTTNKITVDAEGNIFIAQFNSIYEYNSSGIMIATVVNAFNPRGIVIDSKGNIFYGTDDDDGYPLLAKISPTGGYNLSKALPAGLSIDPTTGVISGTPAAGSAPAIYTVTGHNATGSASANVQIGVNVPNNLSLSNLTVSSGTPTPAFSPDSTSYNVSVANTIDSIKITPTATNNTSTLQVNGAAVVSGNATGWLHLSTGNNYFTVAVTSADGLSSQTYSLTVVKKALQQLIVTANNFTIYQGEAIPKLTLTYSGFYPGDTPDSLTTQPVASSVTSSAASGTFPITVSGGVSGKYSFYYVSGTLTIQSSVPSITYTTPKPLYVGTPVTIKPVTLRIYSPFYYPTQIGQNFIGAAGVAVDAGGNVYAAYTNAAITKIPAAGGANTSIGSGLSYPTGVAVDASGIVYVADSTANNVYKIAPGGNPVIIGSGFNTPVCVAVDATGNVFVADAGNNSIKKIPAAGGSPVTLGSGFNYPTGVAVDAAGNVFVADRNNNAVKEIPAGGGSIKMLGSGYNLPSGVAVDPAGNVYISDQGNHVVKKIPAGSDTTTVIGGTFKVPNQLTTNASGDIFVADYGLNEIIELKPGIFTISQKLPPGLGFDNNTGIISGTPTTISADTTYTVTAYNQYGGGTDTITLSVIVAKPTLSYASPQNYHSGTTITPLAPGGANVAVSSYYSPGKYLPNRFNTTGDIAIDGSHNIYMRTGRYITEVKAGTADTVIIGEGLWNNIYGIAADSADNLYMTVEIKNNVLKLLKLPAGGTAFMDISGGYNFSDPSNMNYDGEGNLYVEDYKPTGPDIVKVPLNGALPQKVDSNITNLTAFYADAAGNIYYATDSTTGTKLYELIRGQSAPVLIPYYYGGIVYGMTVDASGNLFIKMQQEAYTTYIYRFSGTKDPVKIYSTSGSVIDPGGLIVDAPGNLYAGFTTSGPRIMVFSPSGGYYIDKTLPVGINFDSNTGIISGTPAKPTPGKLYTITGYNTSGDTTATVQISVDFGQLVQNNFTLAISSATCNGSNNGAVNISAATSMNYLATISGNGVNTSTAFTNTVAFNNLAAGTYSVCVTLPDYPTFSQCFSAVITQPQDLSVYSTINNNTNSVNLALKGANLYTITLNGKLYTTTADSSITLPLNEGANTITVTTDKACQGMVEKSIFYSGKIIPYPNPFDNTVSINLGNKIIGNTIIEIHDVTGGKLFYSKQFANRQGVLTIDLSSLSLTKGIYAMSVSMHNAKKIFKIVKQ